LKPEDNAALSNLQRETFSVAGKYAHLRAIANFDEKMFQNSKEKICQYGDALETVLGNELSGVISEL